MTYLLAEVVRGLTQQIKDAGGRVELRNLPDCWGDEAQVNQVFANLIANAIKYRAPDRSLVVEIDGREQGENVVYCVSDNGLGIAAEHHAAVFEIFHRVGPERADSQGLGLNIVRRIVEKHEGRVWLESELGAGSRFYVALPGPRAEGTTDHG